MTDVTETITTNDTAKPSLEDMLNASYSLRELAETAQINYENSLQELSKAHGSTFTDPRSGQIFQIRHRADSKQGRPITYLCALKAEPKTWLTGRPRKVVDANTSTTAVASQDAGVVSETGGATVIE